MIGRGHTASFGLRYMPFEIACLWTRLRNSPRSSQL